MRHDVQAEVLAELDWDPNVDCGDLAVAADGGAVSLHRFKAVAHELLLSC